MKEPIGKAYEISMTTREEQYVAQGSVAVCETDVCLWRFVNSVQTEEPGSP